jgi:hypothetical protein
VRRYEQLRAMEDLWESIGADPTKMEPPPWHGDALRGTELRYEAGLEQPVDWATAKRGLREHRK